MDQAFLPPSFLHTASERWEGLGTRLVISNTLRYNYYVDAEHESSGQDSVLSIFCK